VGVNIWKNRNQLYLDVYVDGYRRREKLNGLILIGDRQTDKETMRLANIARAKRAQQVFCKEWNLIDPVASKQSLFSYIEKVFANSGKRRQCTALAARRYLEKFRGGKTIQLAQINRKWLEDFREFLFSNIAHNTVALYDGIIRSALNRAVKEKILPGSPAADIPSLRFRQNTRVWLNAGEIRALAATPLETYDGEIRRAFLFACFTGLRISDLRTITWGDIEYSPLQLIKRTEKTEECVYIPLGDSAWKIINDGALHDHRENIFPRLAGLKGTSLDQLKVWTKRAGITKNVGWHTARHTFAVQALENGADIYTVSKLLGHTDVKTTQIYAKATDKMKRRAVEALPAVELSGSGEG
jgi:integrase